MPHTAFETQFADLRARLGSGGIEAVFAELAQQLKTEKRYNELFDARLMQARHRLGLPVILTKSIDDLPAEQQAQIDDALVEVCREVGGLLLDDGKIGQAWQYLRHAGQKPKVAAALAAADPGEDEVDELVQVAVHEGVAPRRGFELVLKHFGTCSSVTLFEQVVGSFTAEDRSAVAGLLVAHLHRDVLATLQREISRQEGSQPPEKTILTLVADRDWLFQGDNYHTDTSHLSMTVRFARWCRQADDLRKAIDLTEYGRRLSPQFQSAGDPPFLDHYVDHARFFAAQLSETPPADVERHLGFFRDKAQAADPDSEGTFAAEVYVTLLSRLGRYGEAFDACAELLPDNAPLMGLAPTLLELGQFSRDFVRLQQIYEERQDRVNFVAGLVQERIAK